MLNLAIRDINCPKIRLKSRMISSEVPLPRLHAVLRGIQRGGAAFLTAPQPPTPSPRLNYLTSKISRLTILTRPLKGRATGLTKPQFFAYAPAQRRGALRLSQEPSRPEVVALQGGPPCYAMRAFSIRRCTVLVRFICFPFFPCTSGTGST